MLGYLSIVIYYVTLLIYIAIYYMRMVPVGLLETLRSSMPNNTAPRVVFPQLVLELISHLLL